MNFNYHNEVVSIDLQNIILDINNVKKIIEQTSAISVCIVVGNGDPNYPSAIVDRLWIMRRVWITEEISTLC
jgi:hypothetical protein